MNVPLENEKPTQFELARLAALLRKEGDSLEGGDSLDVIMQRASEFWKAAGRALDPPPAPPQARKAMAFDAFLRELHDKKSVADRMKLFRDFQVWTVRQDPGTHLAQHVVDPVTNFAAQVVPEVNAKTVGKAVDRRMEYFRVEGIADPDGMEKLYREWRDVGRRKGSPRKSE